MLEKRAPKINQSKFTNAVYAQKTYIATPGYGVTLEQLMDESYWGNVARELKAGYMIEVLPEGLTYYARLLVVHADPTRAIVKLLQFNDFMADSQAPKQNEIPNETAIGSKFKAERNGAWFRILRLSDKEVMKTGFRTMTDAEEWAEANLKVDA